MILVSLGVQKDSLENEWIGDPTVADAVLGNLPDKPKDQEVEFLQEGSST